MLDNVRLCDCDTPTVDTREFDVTFVLRGRVTRNFESIHHFMVSDCRARITRAPRSSYIWRLVHSLHTPALHCMHASDGLNYRTLSSRLALIRVTCSYARH